MTHPEFRRQHLLEPSPRTPHQGRNLSTISGRGGGRHGHGGAGRGGRGRGDPGAQQRGLVSQAEIDKVATAENKHYPDKVYAKVFTGREG
jgi:hypothetical protein